MDTLNDGALTSLGGSSGARHPRPPIAATTRARGRRELRDRARARVLKGSGIQVVSAGTIAHGGVSRDVIIAKKSGTSSVQVRAYNPSKGSLAVASQTTLWH